MKEWAFVLSFIGVPVGWFLNQISAARTTSLSDNRVIKEALYFLLRLHNVLSKLAKVNDFADLYIAQMQQRYPEVVLDEEARQEMKDQLAPLLQSILGPDAEQELEELKEGYDACLLKLSAVAPLQAYGLHGKQRLLSSYSLAAATYDEKLTGMLPDVPQEKVKALTGLLLPATRTKLLQETALDLKNTMIALASRLQRTDRKELLSALASDEDSRIRQMVAAYIEEIIVPAFDKMADSEKK